MTEVANQTAAPATAVRTLVRSIPLGKDSGKTFNVELHRILKPESLTAIANDPMLQSVVLVGTSRIFVDVQASAKTDAERQAAVEKKHDAWLAGDFNVRGGGGGGETVEGEVRRILVAAYMAAKGVPEVKAIAALGGGKGFDMLRRIADAKAAATAQPLEDAADATEETKAAYADQIKAEADRIYAEAEAKYRAQAQAALEAKAKAREAAKDFDVTALI